jgi:uncharacterized membrane protein
MSRFGQAAYGSRSAMRRNAVLTYASSGVLLVFGVPLIVSGNAAGWILTGMAVVAGLFVFVASRHVSPRGHAGVPE